MKTQNKIHDLFATPINQFTNEELNILLDHTFNMFVYTVSPSDPNDPKERRIVLDEDHVMPIDESRFLLYYLSKAKVFYKETTKQNARLELQRELKKLLNL